MGGTGVSPVLGDEVRAAASHGRVALASRQCWVTWLVLPCRTVSRVALTGGTPVAHGQRGGMFLDAWGACSHRGVGHVGRLGRVGRRGVSMRAALAPGRAIARRPACSPAPSAPLPDCKSMAPDGSPAGSCRFLLL